MAYGFKTGGRQKGTPNKNTAQVCEKLRTILMDEFESGRVQEALQQLEPKDYIAAVLKLSPYVLSKARPVDYDAEPHAANEQEVNDAVREVETQLEKGKPGFDEIFLENLRQRLKGGETEPFREHMGWTEEQLQRFIDGESPDSISLG